MAEPDQTPQSAASDRFVYCLVSQCNFKTFHRRRNVPFLFTTKDEIKK